MVEVRICQATCGASGVPSTIGENALASSLQWAKHITQGALGQAVARARSSFSISVTLSVQRASTFLSRRKTSTSKAFGALLKFREEGRLIAFGHPYQNA